MNPLGDVNGLPLAPGNFLLSLDPKLVADVIISGGIHADEMARLASLFLGSDRTKWKLVLDTANSKGDLQPVRACAYILALDAAPAEFMETADKAFGLIPDWNEKFAVGGKLLKINPTRFGTAMQGLAAAQLLGNDSRASSKAWMQARDSGLWLVRHCGEAAIPLLLEYFGIPLETKEWTRKNQSEFKNEVLSLAVEKLGRCAVPLFEASFQTDQPEVQLHALQLWSGIKIEGETDRIAARFRNLFGSTESSIVSRAVRFSGDAVLQVIEDDLWRLLSHRSRPVRDAAATTLAKTGDSRLPKAKELWAAKRADTRLAAVSWLRAIGTTSAAAVLQDWLDHEGDDNVRDAILLALEKLPGGLAASDLSELKKRIKKTLAKIQGTRIPWLDIKKLPRPELADGTKLSTEHLRYLLYRQSRVADMRMDIEAKPLFAQLNRSTSGDLALAVLQAFIGSNADAEDRWAMAFAAAVGDDRIVRVLTRQIGEWADHMRGKLAEHAVQALALHGSDAGLLAVDAMAIRYRSKNKNIGKAASEAFAEAARNRGLTVEELGDLVVPWFGFESGKPRVIEFGTTKLEVTINADFKLVFCDDAKNRKTNKIPDNAPAEVRAEFREISASLKEAVKSQLLRMETLMVRQFRWPVARWQELYLRHPLLLPFAQRLLWGAYDATGRLRRTFRALEDQSMTDVADEQFQLQSNGSVGIVHPLELKTEERRAWSKHLADYNIVPPFSQLDRQVVLARRDQANTKFGKEVAETEINAMTFKGRAERLGWVRGSVCDAGCINFYRKSFPTAGVDVFVETEGLYVGIDMYSNITLGTSFFVRHGTVKIGGYEYDEPGKESDPRLVSYGDVPAIAYSEAMGDLGRIAGKAQTQQEELADA